MGNLNLKKKFFTKENKKLIFFFLIKRKEADYFAIGVMIHEMLF